MQDIVSHTLDAMTFSMIKSFEGWLPYARVTLRRTWRTLISAYESTGSHTPLKRLIKNLRQDPPNQHWFHGKRDGFHAILWHTSMYTCTCHLCQLTVGHGVEIHKDNLSSSKRNLSSSEWQIIASLTELIHSKYSSHHNNLPVENSSSKICMAK